jgi:hypothetical protein
MSKQPKTTIEVQGMTDRPVFCAHTELIDIKKLVPDPRNSNLHPENRI